MRPFLIAPLMALTAACAPAAPGSELPARCGPAHGAMTGHNIGEFTLPAGLAHRIVQPGAALTEDHHPDRLNVFVDDKGWIRKVECG